MLHCRHTELFDFQNTMRNSTISKQLRLEEQNIQSSKRETEINQDRDQGSLFSSILENKEIITKHPIHSFLLFHQEQIFHLIAKNKCQYLKRRR